MKHVRRLAFWFLIAALVAILVVGFYLGATHQEARPADTGQAAGDPAG
jgi:type VI protein secretion system component VasF